MSALGNIFGNSRRHVVSTRYSSFTPFGVSNVHIVLSTCWERLAMLHRGAL
jgi:hypothetical protein